MSEIRIKINKSLQLRLFQRLLQAIGRRKKAAKFLNIKEGTYKGFASGRIRYIPKRIVEKVCVKVRQPIPLPLEETTLEEVRKKTIRRTYKFLKEKYGRKWQEVIGKRGRKALAEKYGVHWAKIIGEKGFNTSRNKYGTGFQKRIWEKALISLEKKYGRRWAKINSKKSERALEKRYGKNWRFIVMKKARKMHLKNYGKEWAKILSKKGAITLRKRYGKNYHQTLGHRGFEARTLAPTPGEEVVCQSLRKQNIAFETHCIKKGREYDIVIPNANAPKIVIECTSAIPTTHLEREKIFQLMEQKENFPDAIHIAIVKQSGDGYNFTPATYRFLRDEKIFVVWNEDVKKLSENIKEYLKNNEEGVFNHREHQDDRKNNKNSINGALACKKKKDYYEEKLGRLLNELNIKYERQYMMITKYGNAIVIDDFEKDNKTNVAYEVTKSSNSRALRALAGKIIYLKKLYKTIKVIIILAKIKRLENNITHQCLAKYGDAIILEHQFNKEGLKEAREKAISENQNPNDVMTSFLSNTFKSSKF